MSRPSVNKAEPTLALKPRGDITRSPKQGYQWPHQWTCVQQKILKKSSHLQHEGSMIGLQCQLINFR